MAKLESLKTNLAEGGPANTRIRLESLKRRIMMRTPKKRLEKIQSIFASKDSSEHPICGSKEDAKFYAKAGFFTFSATIMVLGENPELLCTNGPPDRAGYETFRFTTK